MIGSKKQMRRSYARLIVTFVADAYFLFPSILRKRSVSQFPSTNVLPVFIWLRIFPQPAMTESWVDDRSILVYL